jgi:hypothetical protein
LWPTTLTPASCLAIGVCLLAGACSDAPIEGSGGNDVPSAQSLVDKAIEFHGGRKALGRNLALVRTEESEIILEGEKVALKCEWQYQPPNKRAFQAVIRVGTLQLRFLQGIVGDKGWAKIGPSLAVDLSPEQVHGLTWEHDNHLRNVQLLMGSDNYDMAAPLPMRVADRDAWQVKLTNKQTKNKVTVFFDKSTGQVIGDESQRVVPTLGSEKTREKASTFRVIFKSFIDVDGMKMPEALTIYNEGAPVVEVRKAQVRIVDKVDPKLFVKP